MNYRVVRIEEDVEFGCVLALLISFLAVNGIQI